jgi:arsenate reductase
MQNRTYGVLFLCTGNSARSILAEAILNRVGGERFRAYSAGSHPKGEVHPMALQLLRLAGFETSSLRSKGWDEFALPGAPPIDFVFTVCDDAAAEQCPVWPGHPTTAHWGVEDPAAFEGPEAEQLWTFRRVFAVLNRRIDLLVSLPDALLDRLDVKHRLDEIGKTDAEPSGRS